MATDKLVITIEKLLENLSADGISRPIFVADTKSVEFSLVTTDPTSDFEIAVATSYQRITPPDFSQPITADNQFTETAYIDESNGATYNATARYNPASEGGSVSKTFRFNINGAMWVGIGVTSYAAGTLDGVNVLLSDNL